MRTCFQLFAASVVAVGVGCFDGAIEVTFDLPSAADEISTFRLVVYAEASGPLGCNELAFDDIPIDVLETTTVFSGTTERGSPLQVTGVPRKGKKLFFAEAIADNGVSIFAGCEEVGNVDGPTLVDIEPKLRTNATFNSPLVARDDNGSGTIGIVELTVVRLDGVVLTNEPVRWRLRGTASNGISEVDGLVTTDGNGDAAIDIALAEQPEYNGPVELDVRTRWAQSQAQPLTAFLDPSPLTGTLAQTPRGDLILRGSDLLEVGRRSPGAPPSVFVLAVDDRGGAAARTEAHIFSIENDVLVRDPNVVSLGTNALDSGARTLGKLQGEEVDTIVAVYGNAAGDRKWRELGTSVEVDSPFSGIPLKLGASGGCSDGIERLLYAQVRGNEDSIQVATDQALRIDSIGLNELGPLPELVEVGCVRDTLSNFNTLFVFDTENAPTANILATFRPVLRMVPVEGGGVVPGFVPARATTAWIGDFSQESDGGMILGEATDEGPATTRYLLQPIAMSNVSADFQGFDPTPTTVIATSEGDINGDGETDVVSLLAAGLSEGGVRVAIHVSLAIAGSALRLRGTMVQTLNTIGPRLRVADLNADGIDDIIVSSADVLRVFLMGDR